MVNWPVTAKISAQMVAKKMGFGGNPTRHFKRATQKAISPVRIASVTMFLAIKISRNRTGNMK